MNTQGLPVGDDDVLASEEALFRQIHRTLSELIPADGIGILGLSLFFIAGLILLCIITHRPSDDNVNIIMLLIFVQAILAAISFGPFLWLKAKLLLIQREKSSLYDRLLKLSKIPFFQSFAPATPEEIQEIENNLTYLDQPALDQVWQDTKNRLTPILKSEIKSLHHHIVERLLEETSRNPLVSCFSSYGQVMVQPSEDTTSGDGTVEDPFPGIPPTGIDPLRAT